MPQRRTLLTVVLCVFALGGAGWMAWETRWSWGYELVETKQLAVPPEPWFPSMTRDGLTRSKHASKFQWLAPESRMAITGKEGVLVSLDVFDSDHYTISYSVRIAKTEVASHFLALQEGDFSSPDDSLTRGPDLP